MKKTRLLFPNLVLFVLLMLIPTLSQSQSRFGIRGGLNVTNVSLENLPNRSELFGFHLGVFAELPIMADFIALQPELSYSTKGANYEVLGESQVLKLNYVDFLLPVVFHLGSINIEVGPMASYLVSTPDFTVYDDQTIISDAFNKVDAGLSAGLSYNFNHFLIGFRYNQGMVNVTTDNGRTFLGEGKNAAGQVSLGYRF